MVLHWAHFLSYALIVGASAKQRKCKPSIFVDPSLGASGGESLNNFFKQNGHATLFFMTRDHNRSKREPLYEIIMKDFKAGKEDLPRFRELVVDTQFSRSSGTVFVGDLKPSYGFNFSGTRFANDKRLGIRHMLEIFDKIFIGATFIWPIRHPMTYATSASHWSNTSHWKKRLQTLVKRWKDVHCAMYDHYKARICSPQKNQTNNLGDTVIFNLDNLDFPSFVDCCVRISGNRCLKGDLPHKGHHEYRHVYARNDSGKFDAMSYLQANC